MSGETHEATAPTGCTQPEVGCWVEPYLEGKLPEDRQDEFERHYFECPACLRAIQLHQDLVQTMGGGAVDAAPARPNVTSGLRRVPWWGWATGAMAAGLAAFLLVGPLTERRAVDETPFVLRLEGTFRDSAGASTAPAGRDLELVLAVSVPARASVAYDVEIRSAGGTAFTADDIAPSSSSEVSVQIPQDALAPGRYEVTLREKGTEEPLVLRFDFEIEPPER